MKPYIAQIIEHEGKQYKLPFPMKYRELLELTVALELKDSADENDLIYGDFVSIFKPEPDPKVSSPYHIEQTAIRISALSEEQVSVLQDFCITFGITFDSVLPLLDYIKELSTYEN
jgi:hypothetical protein